MRTKGMTESRIWVSLLCVFLGTILLIPSSTPVTQPVITVTVDRTAPTFMSPLKLGVTHTRRSLDNWVADEAQLAEPRALLGAATHYQNQHIMGWGASNPNPSPDVYEWDSLDLRINLIRSMGAEPVITLCCAPDWMKGGAPGETDWDQLEVAPLPQYYDDFAELTRQVAMRYPDVRYFQVWNEFKGFWQAENSNWNYIAYTELYNRVYEAVKSVRPDAQVGGLYLIIEGTGSNKEGWPAETPIRDRQWEVIDYWLEHKRGADFISIDRGLTYRRDQNNYTTAELMALAEQFALVNEQIRTRTNLPIWWSEYHMPRDAEGMEAIHASVLYHLLMGGSDTILLWGAADTEGAYPFFSSLDGANAGQLLEHYRVFRAFREHFGEGAQLYETTSSSPYVIALASDSATALINQLPHTVTVRLNGIPLTLGRYEMLVTTTPLDAAHSDLGLTPDAMARLWMDRD
ncbi:MAG: xylan 1,4-beta-xylosidase [Chloroflexota bacterium]